jgi:hypothetical protein
MTVLYLTSDLLFSSRVTSSASQLGISVTIVRDLDALKNLLAETPAEAVIIDLEHRDADPAAIVDNLPAGSSRPCIVAYGPHVKHVLLDAARVAGMDLVLSRGEFNSRILDLLQQFPRTQSSEP